MKADKFPFYIFKEISETLGLQLDLETLPAEEGGFKETWKFLGKNSAQISLIVSIAAIIISRFPIENKELTTLQIENLKLDNELVLNPVDSFRIRTVASLIGSELLPKTLPEIEA